MGREGRREEGAEGWEAAKEEGEAEGRVKAEGRRKGNRDVDMTEMGEKVAFHLVSSEDWGCAIYERMHVLRKVSMIAILTPTLLR